MQLSQHSAQSYCQESHPASPILRENAHSRVDRYKASPVLSLHSFLKNIKTINQSLQTFTMFKLASIALVAAALSSSVSAYTLHFHNNCPYTIWPAVGAAPYGQPDLSVSWGARVDPGGEAFYEADYNKRGLRSWARTGCDDSGSNCQTGANVGGLNPTDAGLQSNAIYFESGPVSNLGRRP